MLFLSMFLRKGNHTIAVRKSHHCCENQPGITLLANRCAESVAKANGSTISGVTRVVVWQFERI